MGDSDDLTMLSKQSKELANKHDNYPGLEMLSTNRSISKDENDGPEPKKHENDHDIDIVMSDENFSLNETNVDNLLAENSLQEPNDDAEHAIIEIGKTADENVLQNSTNVDNDESRQGINTKLKTIAFFLTDIALPTIDVYSDLSLVIGWYWNRHWNFAISMTIPLVLQFLATCYKWIRVEKKENKVWSWITLILQCWPQVRALRIINLDVKNNLKAETKKNEFMREVTSSEPFLEAFPSVMIMAVIWIIALEDNSFTSYCIEHPEYKECPEYNNTRSAPPEFCDKNPDINRCAVYGRYWWFLTTFAISFISCALGVTKFQLNGPFSVISSEGPLGGMMTWRFCFGFCAAISSIYSKVLTITFGVRYWRLDESEQEYKIMSMASFVSVEFGLLVIPNLIFSLVSIGFSTGLNKKFLEVTTRYPAAWMLPICTFFVIGPRRISCDSKADEQRCHLVLSKGLTMVNMMLTSIMIMIILISKVNHIRYHEIIVYSALMIVLLSTSIFSHIIFLFPKMKCNGLKLSLNSDQITTSTHDIHAIDVSQDELRPFKIPDPSENDC